MEQFHSGYIFAIKALHNSLQKLVKRDAIFSTYGLASIIDIQQKSGTAPEIRLLHRR
jgi:hypothetical protein